MAIQSARLPQPDEPFDGSIGLDAIDPSAAIGEQLRELRQVKNLPLREVAERAGISVGYLSQLERNHSRLPIGVLKRISDALGVHMNWFFQQNNEGDPAERDVVVRSNNRKRMSFTGLGIQEELLSPNLSGPLELLISTIDPKADSEDYFANVETLLGVRKAPAAEEPLSSASRRSTPPPAAPVSRETRGGNVVRLTSEEREMADMMKMTPEEYAKNKVALKKEGRLN